MSRGCDEKLAGDVPTMTKACAVWFQLAAFGISCGAAVGVFERLDPLRASGTALLLMAACPVVPVLWTKLTRWSVFPAAAVALLCELAAAHVAACFGRCLEMTGEGIAVPFVFLYFAVTMPAAFFLWSFTAFPRRNSA